MIARTDIVIVVLLIDPCSLLLRIEANAPQIPAAVDFGINSLSIRHYVQRINLCPYFTYTHIPKTQHTYNLSVMIF